MTYKTFEKKFKAAYSEVRCREELAGVVAIGVEKLCQSFAKAEGVELEAIADHLERLKAEGKVFTSRGENRDLLHWRE